jgi:hypothetical protein
MTALFQLVNKTTEKVEQELTLSWADVHEDCEDFVKLYGLTKLVQDRESGADMLEKLEAYQACFNDTLLIGVLARTRKSGGPTVRIEIEALASVKGITVKQAQLLLRKYEKDDQEKILASESVVAQVAVLSATEEPAEGDLDDLLG